MTTFHIIRPCDELKHVVSHFWSSRWEAGVQTDFTYRATANVLTEWVFAFRPSGDGRCELTFSLVQGHTASFASIPAKGFSEMFGVALYSYTMPCFFNASAGEMAGQLVDIGDVLRGDAPAVSESMAAALSTPQRVATISAYLKAKLAMRFQEDRIVIGAIKKISGHQGMVNIAALAAETGLSQKQFDRRFKAYTGFNPKLYSRIHRFESALWHRRQYATLTDLAYAHGYYDQAHFIHDFKSFSGFNPNQFFSLVDY